MSAQDKELVRSTAPGSSGMVVPQGHDPVADAWVPIKVAADGTLLAQLTGSILAELQTIANQAANTDFGEFTATFTGIATVQISLAVAGILSLSMTPGGGAKVTSQLLSGQTITAGQVQAFNIVVTAGATYALQTSVLGNVTFSIVGGV